MDAPKPALTASPMMLALLALPVLLIGGAIGWAWHSSGSDPASGLAKGERAAIEAVVKDYILTHPEILPQAMENLQARENAKQLSGIRKELETPFPGAILGNPAGTVTLVEFTDFACTYCRQSAADVEELVRTNPDLKVVIREFPILSPQSADAAKMGLAAARQGKYAAFHRLMFAAGRPDQAAIEAAAKAAGVDLAKARAAIASADMEAELVRNVTLARQLGFTGTPSWVVGDAVLSGAVGKDRLAEAIAAAGKS
jgi:protein-disulfide isomerase